MFVCGGFQWSKFQNFQNFQLQISCINGGGRTSRSPLNTIIVHPTFDIFFILIDRFIALSVTYTCLYPPFSLCPTPRSPYPHPWPNHLFPIPRTPMMTSLVVVVVYTLQPRCCVPSWQHESEVENLIGWWHNAMTTRAENLFLKYFDPTARCPLFHWKPSLSLVKSKSKIKRVRVRVRILLFWNRKKHYKHKIYKN